MLARVFSAEDIDVWNDSVSLSDIGTGDAIMTWKIKEKEISVWKVDESKSEYVALAWYSNRDKVSDLVIANIDENILAKVDFNEEEGNTIFGEMQKNHRNLINLDFWSIGFLSEHFTKQVKEQKYIYLTEEEIKEAFYKAIKEKKLLIENLKEKLRNRLLNDYKEKYKAKLID